MKFFLDANLPNNLVDLIRKKFGVPVRKVPGVLSDEQIYAKAKRQDRCLLSLDTDFLNILKYPPGHHSGIIVFRLKDQSRENVCSVVIHFCDMFKGRWHLLKGNTVVVRETRFRIYTPSQNS